MSALRVLFQALNNESDPYRVSIEPLDIKEAKVYQNTLELTKTKFTSRVYFKLENGSLSFENVKFEDSDETFILYDKYEKNNYYVECRLLFSYIQWREMRISK